MGGQGGGALLQRRRRCEGQACQGWWRAKNMQRGGEGGAEVPLCHLQESRAAVSSASLSSRGFNLNLSL